MNSRCSFRGPGCLRPLRPTGNTWSAGRALPTDFVSFNIVIFEDCFMSVFAPRFRARAVPTASHCSLSTLAAPAAVRSVRGTETFGGQRSAAAGVFLFFCPRRRAECGHSKPCTTSGRVALAGAFTLLNSWDPPRILFFVFLCLAIHAHLSSKVGVRDNIRFTP
ncbi:unnamed protein product [Prorocentrum cordatum]|uniref:Transmembrane protein n=1 Tax=Prorocentrum cordatum TaxID=2364126 RepID=A0ABN9XIA4_9DINO|nr:unnamed protein product [Polarella glacialis]